MKYNSGINIMGSIPDYASMIQYIIDDKLGVTESGPFKFRTSKSLKRFIAGIEDSILSFTDDKHEKLFYEALSSLRLNLSEKYLVVFWQMIYCNSLFYDITEEVFMKAVYQGRNTLSLDDVYSFVRHLKQLYPRELNWSEATLKTLASKYLTIIKKIGLAEGCQRKHICHPLISDSLFVYFIRWCQCVCPSDRTMRNPYIQFGFSDTETLISRLKRIDYIPYWDITQMGNELIIDLKPYE